LIDNCSREARRLKDEYVSVEHLVTALLDEGSHPQPATAAGAWPDRRRFPVALTEIRGTSGHLRDPRGTYEALGKYGRDLVAEAARPARAGDRRDAEIRRTIQILSRKTKNNPVLIGEPGVGKTAIVEGLAQRINNGDVPRGCATRPSSRSTWAPRRGAKYRGEFEERSRRSSTRCSGEGRILLFVDELHTVGRRRAPRKAPWMPATCSSRCWRVVSCT
jgi:ATP-dependent Clp protease ATP-binding subunit ClpB